MIEFYKSIGNYLFLGKGVVMQLHVRSYQDLSRDELYDICRVRMETFIVEQGINYVDLDEQDRSSVHVWMTDEKGIQAYLRIFLLDNKEASLGRVLTRRRGQGLGTAILRAGLEAIKEHYGVEIVRIHAQAYVQDLYAKEGFVPSSELFLEEGIEHIEMVLTLKP